MANQVQVQVQGTQLGTPSLAQIEARDADVKVAITSLAIKDIQGSTTAGCHFTAGKANITFSARLYPQVQIDDAPQAAGALAAVERVIEHAFERVDPKVRDEVLSKIASTFDGSLSLPEQTEALDIPDVSFQTNASFVAPSATSPALALEAATSITTSSVDLARFSIDDFALTAPPSQPVTAQRVQVDNVTLPPADIPTLGLGGIALTATVPSLSLSGHEIPLSASADSATSDIDFLLINWNPHRDVVLGRMELFGKILTFSLKLDIQLKLDLHYKWLIRLAMGSVRVGSAVAQGVSVALSIPKLVFSGIKFGVGRIGRVVSALT
jgi:hypothetical protein